MTIALLAFACPDCPPVRDARALVFAEGFWTNAGAALLPFVLVLLIVRWIVGRFGREEKPR